MVRLFAFVVEVLALESGGFRYWRWKLRGFGDLRLC